MRDWRDFIQVGSIEDSPPTIILTARIMLEDNLKMSYGINEVPESLMHQFNALREAIDDTAKLCVDFADAVLNDLAERGRTSEGRTIPQPTPEQRAKFEHEEKMRRKVAHRPEE